jgi:hypothetical protein
MELKINEPCPASWNEMSKGDQGRFCNLCSKDVIDFTSWSDKQLKDFFANNRENVCGKLADHQLNRHLFTGAEQTKLSSRIAAMFFGALSTLQLLSQNNDRDECGKTAGNLIVRGCRPTIEIKGHLSEKKTGESIAFANVGIPGDQNTITDLDGNFKLQLKPQNIDDTIRISFIGYENKAIPVKDIINNNDSGSIKIELELKAFEMSMGLIIVTEPKVALHKRIFRKIQKLCRREN